MSDLLDWQITDAPNPDEFPSVSSDSSPVPHPRRSLPTLSPRAARHITLTLGGVIVLVLTSIGVYWAWNRAQVQLEIEHIIARENEADRADDWAMLRALVADTSLPDWRTQFYGISPPLPALAPTWSNEVRAITPVESNLVRAEVITHYQAPDGTPLTFIRDQYYRYLNGEWKRAAPPNETWQETLSFESAYFSAGYAAVDEALVKPALLEAETQFARVCARWPCADVPEIKLSFSATTYRSGYPGYEASNASLLYQAFLEAGGYERTLTWPALRQSGYPADEVTQHWYQHVLTLSLFQRFTNQLALTYELDERSVLARALALRLATQLGLETFPVNEVWVTQPAYTVSELWAGRTAQGRRANIGLWDPSVTLRAALVVMNRLLRDQPLDVEDRLFAALLDATDEVDWVARGLGVSRYEAQTQLAALAQTDLPAVRVLATPATKFILGCGDGVYGFSTDQLVPTQLLEGVYLNVNLYSWSPNGRHLLVELNGQVGVINFESLTVTWLPLMGTNDYHALRWVNNTLIAYTEYENQFSPGLQVFDILQPEHPVASLEDASDYFRAPDSSMGIVIQPATDGANHHLALMTSPAEAPRPIAEGEMLAWSPDSQLIAYVWRGQHVHEFALRLMNIQTGVTRDLLTDADVFTTVEDHIALDDGPWVGVQWMPDGQRLAFTLTASGWNELHHTWAGLIDTTTNSSWEPLPLAMPKNAYPAGFSADGQWLAMVAYEISESSDPRTTTQLYSVLTGQPVRTFPQASLLGWSPTGHQLVLWDETSLYLLTEPAEQTAPPLRLANLPCLNLTWNPNL